MVFSPLCIVCPGLSCTVSCPSHWDCFREGKPHTVQTRQPRPSVAGALFWENRSYSPHKVSSFHMPSHMWSSPGGEPLKTARCCVQISLPHPLLCLLLLWAVAIGTCILETSISSESLSGKQSHVWAWFFNANNCRYWLWEINYISTIYTFLKTFSQNAIYF